MVLQFKPVSTRGMFRLDVIDTIGSQPVVDTEGARDIFGDDGKRTCYCPPSHHQRGLGHLFGRIGKVCLFPIDIATNPD